MEIRKEENNQMMLENEKVKKELDKMCERSSTRIEMIAYLLGRFTGYDDIPYELVDYAMSLSPDVQIIR